MPLLKFNRFKIFYQVYGKGPLLILHHGFGSEGQDWNRTGWIEALEPHATVLTFDAVGHGKSTLSHDTEDHEIEKRAEVVNVLADDLGAAKFGFFGFSLGGRTGFELAASSPERITMLIVGGMHLLPPCSERERIERRVRILRSGRAKSVEKPTPNRPANDPLSLAAANEALLRWQGAEQRLANHSAPTLLFCGDRDMYFDNAKETAKTMNFSFTALPNTDHYSSFGASKLAVNTVKEFVRQNLK